MVPATALRSSPCGTGLAGSLSRRLAMKMMAVLITHPIKYATTAVSTTVSPLSPAKRIVPTTILAGDVQLNVTPD